MRYKICTKCKVNKPLLDYGFHRYGKNKKQPRCKKCRNNSHRQERLIEEVRKIEILQNIQYRSRPEIRERMNKYSMDYRKNPLKKSKILEYSKKHNRELKLTVVNEYGGKCVCCGEDRFEFLSIEHSFGDGRKYREKIGGGRVYRDLKKRGFPKDEGIQVMCFNCNCSRGFYKCCPHEKECLFSYGGGI